MANWVYWCNNDVTGSFIVGITQRKSSEWRIIVAFEILLHIKDINILYNIKDFFGVGGVYSRPARNAATYKVQNIADLNNIIIPHFETYPLLSMKWCDFQLWKKVVQLMQNKEHLTTSGFELILSLYASINRGISKKVAENFTISTYYPKPNRVIPSFIHPYWISGFTAGDGSFIIELKKKENTILFSFDIT